MLYIIMLNTYFTLKPIKFQVKNELLFMQQ